MSVGRVVVVSKDPQVYHLAAQVAREIFVADDADEALDIIATVEPDLIVLDEHRNADDASEFFSKTKAGPISIPIVVIANSRSNSNTIAQHRTMAGLAYLQDRTDSVGLEQIVRRLKTQDDPVDPDSDNSRFFATDYATAVGMVGQSKAMLDSLRMIKLVALSQCNPVLIVGETGTGKELAAKAIHTLRCADEKFVAVNCAALTATLLESELFGHVKGSFTGADRDKTGLLEMTGRGTILLDEISEMRLDLQAKLLRVLQEKTFRKVGGTEDIACKATIIASSNRDLNEQVRTGRFRRDLYYRLNICPITLAPLRSADRKDDVTLLGDYFLKTSTICPNKANKITSLTKLAREALRNHNWPGNVREVRNVIEKAILLESTDKIGLSSIVFDSLEQGDSAAGPGQGSHIKDFSLAKAEKELIIRALHETGWQKTRAAALLGITRATLYAKVKQYKIEKNTNAGVQICRPGSLEERLTDQGHQAPNEAVSACS